MAIDLRSPDERAKLARAIRYANEQQCPQRDRRKTLIDIYKGESSLSRILGDKDDRKYGTLLNLFQQYVRGHLAALAYRTPKFSVRARTQAGRGFDMRLQKFLQRYSEILDLQRVFRQSAMDSAFGNAVVKVISSIAPKGITAPVAPRAYRIDPNLFIMDPAAPVPEEASFMADIYLVPLNEAKNHPTFRPAGRAALQPWRDTSSNSPSPLPNGVSDIDTLAEEHTRLIDVYIPALGVICTWAAATDTFETIGTEEPLQVMPCPICPYEVLQLLTVPGNLEEVSRLWALRGLHLLANDMYNKAAHQGRKAKRNPVDKIGNEHDMHNLSTAGDGEEVFMQDPSSLDLYQVPGPDASIMNLAQNAAGLFSHYAGNLEVALGQSTGAETARQTQALIGQINAQQAIDRNSFEIFLANVAKKLGTLAFYDDQLLIDINEKVPGTNYSVNFGWAPPQLMPRAGSIDDYFFETVPYSSAFRSPQERLGQLDAASKGIMAWMMAGAQGAPINLEAVMNSYGEAFDLVPEVKEWWSGQPPTPQQQTSNTYSSNAGPSQGSDVNYNSNAGGGGGEPAGAPDVSQQGGLQSAGGV